MTALELARKLKAMKSSTTCNVMNPGLIPTTGKLLSVCLFFMKSINES